MQTVLRVYRRHSYCELCMKTSHITFHCHLYKKVNVHFGEESLKQTEKEIQTRGPEETELKQGMYESLLYPSMFVGDLSSLEGDIGPEGSFSKLWSNTMRSIAKTAERDNLAGTQTMVLQDPTSDDDSDDIESQVNP